MSTLDGQMPVFDRSGARIGTLTKWSVTRARAYRLNEVDDFGFVVPQRDEHGADVLTTAVAALLARDNLVFVENEVDGLPGWGGAISEVVYEEGGAQVSVLGGLSLFDSLDTLLISQSDGTSDMLASRLVGAANAKQGAHGDLLVSFVQDDTTPNYGLFEYEGDILKGLMEVADKTIAEFYVQAAIAPDGSSISFALHWSSRFFTDLRSITLTDGPGGQVASGGRAIFSGLEVINRARLRGSATTIADHIDYASVAAFIDEIAPEVEVSFDTPSNFRRRENLELSVSFGYSDAIQRGLATAIQQKYVDYYKTFLYAYHERNGMPFLPGYDWRGPGQGWPERKLTETDFRTINKLGLIGKAAIISVDSDRYTRETATEEADITGWDWERTIDTTVAVGMARSPRDLEFYVIADSGWLYHLDDQDNLDSVFAVAAAGETLVSVATDDYQPDYVWCLYTTGSGARVRWYDFDEGTVIGSFDIAGETDANDFTLDAENGQFFMVSTSSGTVQRRDINSGVALDAGFDSGFSSPVGISSTGGFLYVIDDTGKVRILFNGTGNLAGTSDAGVTARGIFVSPENRRVFVMRPNGNIMEFSATIAIASIDDEETETGAPGFDVVRKGHYTHIVMTDDLTYRPWKRASHTTHVVAAGETLWGLAVRYYGVGSNWREIYNRNRSEISADAVAHGEPASSHRLFAGTVLAISGAGGLVDQDEAVSPKVRYLTASPKRADWKTEIVPGPIGEPDIIEKRWDVSDRQDIGTVKAKRCRIVEPKVVIYGEEGRVNDWDPKRDGYGLFRHRRIYSTRGSYSRDKGPGWYPQDWDIPDAEWVIDPPAWPEGEAYLTAYVNRLNAEVSVQSFAVINRANLWGSIRLGGVYHLTLTQQGPVPSGISLDIRVVGFAPSEMTGTCELFAEVYLG